MQDRHGRGHDCVAAETAAVGRSVEVHQQPVDGFLIGRVAVHERGSDLVIHRAHCTPDVEAAEAVASVAQVERLALPRRGPRRSDGPPGRAVREVDLDLDGGPTAGVPHPAAVELGDPRVCHGGATFRSSDDPGAERCPCLSSGGQPSRRCRKRRGGAGREREGKGKRRTTRVARSALPPRLSRAIDSAIVQSGDTSVKRWDGLRTGGRAVCLRLLGLLRHECYRSHDPERCGRDSGGPTLSWTDGQHRRRGSAGPDTGRQESDPP